MFTKNILAILFSAVLLALSTGANAKDGADDVGDVPRLPDCTADEVAAGADGISCEARHGVGEVDLTPG